MAIFFRILPFLPWLIFIQGILLSAIVLSKGSFKSNRYLGSFLVLLSLHGLVSLLWLIPQNRIFAEIYVGLGAFPFLYGPLIYRYVWHSLYRDVNDSIPFVVHCIPSILDFSFFLIFYLAVGRMRFLEISETVLVGQGPLFVSIIEWIKILHGLFYCVLVIRMLFRHRVALKKLASSNEHRRWLVALLTVFAVNWLFVLVSSFFLWLGNSSESRSIIFSGIQLVAFLAFMYTLAFFAFRFPVILSPRAVREEIKKKLNLPEGFVEETLRRLEKAQDQKFYTDTEITLSSLASDLGLHSNALSFIINETQGKGFREYLNGLRVREFLENVEKNPEGQSLLSHAFDAGFTSKSTFLRAFKGEYSQTPLEYLQKKGIKTHI